MKRPYKIARKVVIYLVLFLILSVGSLTLYLRFNKDRIEERILNSINQQQSGLLTYNDLTVSTLRSFPLVSLTFEDLRYYESLDTTKLPILKANKFSIVPNVLALIRGETIIDKVAIAGVEVHMTEDENGELNLNKALQNPLNETTSLEDRDSIESSKDIVIDINEFNLKDASFTLDAFDKRRDIKVDIEDLYGELLKTENANQFEVKLVSNLTALEAQSVAFNNSIAIDLESDIVLRPTKEQFYVNDVRLKLNDISTSLISKSREGSSPELVLNFKAPLKSTADLVKKTGFINEGIEVKRGEIELSAAIENILEEPTISASFQIENSDLTSNGNPLASDMAGDLLFDLSSDKWQIDLSRIDLLFKKNHLQGDIKFLSDSSDHFDIWTDLTFELNEENLADSIYAKMDIQSLFSIDILPSGELTFNDSTSLRASVKEARFNRQTLDEGLVVIEPANGLLNLEYKTISAMTNDIDLRLAIGPFYQKELLPDLKSIPFKLGLEGQNIDLAYLEFEELKRIAELDLKVQGEINGIEGSENLEIKLLNLELFSSDDEFDFGASGDFTVNIDTQGVSLISQTLRVNGTDFDLIFSDAHFLLGQIANSGNIHVTADELDMNALGEFLLVDSTNFLMRDSTFLSSDLTLSGVMMDNDSFSIQTIGALSYRLADNYYSVDKADISLEGIASQTIESLNGKAAINGLHVNNYNEYPLEFSVNYEAPFLNLEIGSFDDMFEGEGNVKIRAELTEEPRLFLDYHIQSLDLGEFWSQYQKAKFINGTADFSIELSTYVKHFYDSLNGSAQISGKDWFMYGFNLDEILTDYKRSQNFQLKDVGAFFMMGPFGPLVSKGYDFTRLVSIDTAGQTQIKEFNADWIIEKGELTAQDMAFATEKNRVAAKGSIDFESREWKNLKIGVLDKNGCSLLEQEVNGPFSDPTFSDINVIGTLLGSVINVLKIASFQKCDPFYSGKVRHPY